MAILTISLASLLIFFGIHAQRDSNILQKENPSSAEANLGFLRTSPAMLSM
jgi:hypothetical protein